MNTGIITIETPKGISIKDAKKVLKSLIFKILETKSNALTTQKPNKKTLEAMKEVEEMRKNPNRKMYSAEAVINLLND